ncbi:hypothetical protein [Myceligenerans halotolerans]
MNSEESDDRYAAIVPDFGAITGSGTPDTPSAYEVAGALLTLGALTR